MPSFKVVPSQQNILLDSAWKDAVKFNSKDRVVTKEGREYRIIAKKEREFSCTERGARGFFGLIATVMTLGYLFSSKMVQELLFDSKETCRFAVEVEKNPGTVSPSDAPNLLDLLRSNTKPIFSGIYDIASDSSELFSLAIVDGKMVSVKKRFVFAWKPADIDPKELFVKILQSVGHQGVEREDGEGYESTLSFVLNHPSNNLFTKDELITKLKEKNENGVPLLFTLNAMNLLYATKILSETEVQITADNGDNLLHVLARRGDKDTLEKLIDAHPSLLKSGNSLLLEAGRDPWKEIWNFLLDFYAKKGITLTELELLAKKVLEGGTVTKNAFNALNDENKKKIFSIANTHENEKVVTNLKKWGMGEKPIYRIPGLDIASANMDFVQVREVVTDYFKSLHERGLILTREEFDKLDRATFYREDKGDDIGRIAGRDFVEKVARDNGLTMIKAPRKIIVVDGDKKTFRVHVTEKGQVTILDKQPKVTVYAELVSAKEEEYPRNMEIARQYMIALEKTGFNDFSGHNFIRNEKGMYFIDTEFKNFDPDRPYFGQIQVEAPLAGPENEKAYLAEFAARKEAFKGKAKEREERLAEYTEMRKDPLRNLMGGCRNVFEISLLQNIK